jgi:hypothetical protein
MEDAFGETLKRCLGQLASFGEWLRAMSNSQFRALRALPRPETPPYPPPAATQSGMHHGCPSSRNAGDAFQQQLLEGIQVLDRQFEMVVGGLAGDKQSFHHFQNPGNRRFEHAKTLLSIFLCFFYKRCRYFYGFFIDRSVD